MSDDKRVDREGIFIEKDLAESLDIEEELDSQVVGPYRFPSPMRRRIAGWIFIGFAAGTFIVIDGGWLPAIGFLALAAWQFAASWPLNIDEHQALAKAGAAVSFPIGHASAAVTFRGFRSRPRWNVVLYSASEPPDQRAMVIVDAVSGEIAEEPYVEEVPPVHGV